MPATFLVDLKNAVTGGSSIRPQAALTANTNGVAVDLLDADGPVHLVVNAGDIDTASADETYAFKLQESADGSTGWADITGATLTITADNQRNIVGTNLRSKRYVRAVLTVGGTTPSILVCADIMARKKITGSGTGYQS